MVPDGVIHYARFPEAYNSGTWSVLPQPKRQAWYPFMFVLPSGNVFYAGADDTTHILRMSDGAWLNINQTNAPLPGGNAVMYRPGKVMKCGTPESGQSVTRNPSEMRTATSVISFDSSDITSGWVYSDDMDSARVYHNLTILPNGKVLVTGGTGKDDMSNVVNPVTGPRIWDPDQGSHGTWSGSGILATEPVWRNYHSTALLLPDGRILSAGGNEIPTDSLVTIYCPPYLFDSSGNLASRPSITGAPDTLGYGGTITICTAHPESIASACLIKPGAVTHTFNQDQRYVPLAISTTCASGHLLVSGPANANYAPPGDYLLFLVDNHGVPAIARWALVNGSGGLDRCDAVAPAQVTDLAVAVGKTTAAVTWTDTGDDSLCGIAKLQDVRYSGSAITDANFGSATVFAGIPAPSTAGTSHCVEVSGLTKGKTYWFGIKVCDDANNRSILQVVSATTHTSGAEVHCNASAVLSRPDYVYDLGAAQPNPSSGRVGIMFSMAQDGPASIRIYDVSGRLVRTLFEGPAIAGPHQLEWNNADNGGRRVHAGVYFYQMKAGSWESRKKMVFLEN